MARRGDPTVRVAPGGSRDVAARPVPGVHAASIGLLLVLLALTAFAVTAAVTNARAADRAQRSAVVSAVTETALDQLVLEENVVDELKSPGPGTDGEEPGEYAAARAAVRAALVQLADSVVPRRRGEVESWIELHERYGQEVRTLLAAGPHDPALAEAYEEEHLDRWYDPLESALEAEVQHQWREASRSLAGIRRTQQVLVVATPVVFGMGLALVVVFSVIQTRGRRLALAQAVENRHQALHDALTGLPNRTLLRDRLEEFLAVGRPRGSALTLLLLDLDRFRDVNNTLGHRYGDLVLRVVAGRLRDCLPAGATVARLGGDEFAVLLPDAADPASALRVSELVLGALDATIDVDGLSLDVDASVGVVVSGPHARDVDTLLQRADIAMYHAKARGHGVCLYDSELDDHSREQLALLGELRRALDGGELLLGFQPKVSLPDEGFCGVEALVRWQHPERGLLPPTLFVPVAERTALIHPLTRYVLSAALAECRRWQDRGRSLHVAVNVSVRNLTDDTFVGDVVGLLGTWGVPASCLELEVTETAVMAEPERVRGALADLAALGVTLSIDDFGAGYTSLAHLTTLPVDTVKVDRSLVQRMAGEPGSALVVRSVIELAHGLGLRTVGEGVEDRATAEMLADLGCDVAQGYLFAPPMSSDRLEEWFGERRVAVRVGPAQGLLAFAPQPFRR